MTCDICLGSGKIKLSKSLSVRTAQNTRGETFPATDYFREYPCPECSPKADEARVFLCSTEVRISMEEMDHPDRKEMLMQDTARRMANLFLAENLISFSEVTTPQDKHLHRESVVRARCGVISRSHVASMEERITRHQDEFAERVIKAATEAFANSRYGWSRHEFTNDVATNLLRRAVQYVKDGR